MVQLLWKTVWWSPQTIGESYLWASNATVGRTDKGTEIHTGKRHLPPMSISAWLLRTVTRSLRCPWKDQWIENDMHDEVRPSLGLESQLSKACALQACGPEAGLQTYIKKQVWQQTLVIPVIGRWGQVDSWNP